jgi:hypothetical protein
VQPILMNTCVSCHSNGRGGSFQLHRGHDGGARAATLRNLAAVLAHVDPQRPHLSPFLIKSISAHGPSAVPPIGGKKSESIPFRTLQDWVERTLASNPHLRERGEPEPRWTPEPQPVVNKAPLPTPTTKDRPEVLSKAEVVSRDVPRPAAVQTMPMAPKSAAPLGTSAGEKGSPVIVSEPRKEDPAAPRPNDPFDPEIFNRQGRPR